MDLTDTLTKQFPYAVTKNCSYDDHFFFSNDSKFSEIIASIGMAVCLYKKPGKPGAS